MANYADLKSKTLQLTDSLITNTITSSAATTDLVIGNNLTTGSVNIGSALSTTNLKGTATATTVATATDSSTNIATTAFVQLLKSIANTWAMLQTFTSGILTSSVNPLTSGNLAIGSSMTTGTNITIGPSTETSTTNIYGKNTNIGTSQLSTTIIGTNTGNLQLNGAIILNANSSYNIDIGRTAGGITTMKSPTIHCGQTTAGSTTNVTGATVNVNTTGTGVTNIGNTTGALTLTGNTTANLTTTSTAITQANGTNDTTIATTAFVQGLKAIANTWALLQTFTGGILASSIQSLTSTTVMNIGTSLINGTVINIGPSFTGGCNTNINGLITMNGTATNSINIGNTTGGTTHIKANTINIQAEAPIDDLKQLTIGGTSGAFNSKTTMNGLTTITKLFTDALQASSLSGISNIFTTKTAGGVTNIGSSASTVNLNGTVTAPTVATATDSSTNIATTAFVQGLKAIANTWALLQTFTGGIQTASIQSTSATTTMTIGSNLTGGANINIGGATATGANMNINGRLDVNSNNGSSSINFGTVTGGTTHLKSLTNNIGAETQTTNNGVINIGQTTGEFSTLTTINGRLTTTGTTNINTTGGSITTIGNISAHGRIYLLSPDIQLGTTTTILEIGTLTGAGFNRLNKPLRPAYESSKITSNDIGYTVFETLTLDEIFPYGDRNMFSAVTLPKGVWLIQCTARINSDNASGTNIDEYVFWCRDSIDYNTRPIFMVGNSNTTTVKSLTNSTSAIITSDGTTSYTIAFYMTYNNTAPNIIRLQTTGDYKSSVKRTRIA